MTVRPGFTTVSIGLMAALFVAACGQASFSPTSPSTIGGRTNVSGTGAVITGTVSGMALATTSATESGTAAAAKPVTITVVGTSISTTIDGSGRFQLSDVPVGNVQLKFTATGLDATLTLTGVEAGDRIDIKVRVTDTSVRIEAEQRDRKSKDDDDDDDDDDNDDNDDNEVKGVVSTLAGTCPDITFKVNTTVVVKASRETRFDDPCASVLNNVRVEVKGRRLADGSIQATRIEIDN